MTTTPTASPASSRRLPAALLACALLAGCAASIPQDSYGVDSLELEGVEKLDDEALRACLATYPRERLSFAFGSTGEPNCGVPPFDASHLPMELWAWPWTDWPIWNETAFERDLERIERWYVARGYYEARVTNVAVARNPKEREVDITLTIEEGEPVLIVRLRVRGMDKLSPEVQARVLEALELEAGDPFDEAYYDRSKQGVLDVLHEASYARATVTGTVEIDPDKKIARVEIVTVPGPPCRFGDVIVEGAAPLPTGPIRAAADIDPGAPFSISAMRDARRAVFGLGPFASVRVEHHMRPDSPVADVLVRVLPARSIRWGIGAGIESGGIYSQEGNEDDGTGGFAQWDVHLIGKFEHKNFLGGMRKLRIEERPMRIFDDKFPGIGDAAWGNRLTVELRQPGFIEPRTTLVGRSRWDRGPDPFGGRFLRHDIVAGAGPERFFLGGTLRLTTTINTDVIFPDEQRPYPDTQATYLHHRAYLDLRDNPRNTTRGSYYQLGVQHTAGILPSNWEYMRVTGDARGYVPLPLGLVLAGRVKLGFMEVFSSDIVVPPRPSDCTDPTNTDACNDNTFLDNLASYGPLRHRLRGGGHKSVRGYEPNRLGDVEILEGRLLSGGLRQWEASVELRVPITPSFGAAIFVDAGDVSRARTYRLDHPQTSIGLGLRYRTLIGPLRFDAALAPDGLQTIGEDRRPDSTIGRGDLFGLGPGAVHITIGEAF